MASSRARELFGLGQIGVELFVDFFGLYFNRMVSQEKVRTKQESSVGLVCALRLGHCLCIRIVVMYVGYQW